jgi:HK97 family phage prohead protease
MDRQVRITSGTSLYVRGGSQGDEGSLIICGRAIGYDQLSSYGVPYSGCRERIARGAFKASLASDQPVLMDYNHSSDALPLGSTKNGTLGLTDLDDGLHFTLRLNPKVSLHRDVHELCRSGTLNKCSFLFGVAPSDDSWSEEDDENDRSQHYRLRTVNRGTLFGLSLVNYPAYDGPTTYAGARSSVAYALNSARPNDLTDVYKRAEAQIDRYHRECAIRLADEIKRAGR